MLEIINRLKPFMEDNYRRINVREYARMQKISPPTASKLLDVFFIEKILKKEVDKLYIYYYANKDSQLFIDLSRLYWRSILDKSGMLNHFENKLLSPVVILFGSLSKAEAKSDSDIDIAIFTPTEKKLNLKKYEKILKREIQVMQFHKMESVTSKELLYNILNGYKLSGSW